MIAETGAGQHGVATATAAALFGLDCTIYMGEVDTERQALNVARMRLLGAEVCPVKTGSRTLKDAINEAMRDWVTNVETTNYIFGTAAGPHPFPAMVRDLQQIIGEEARAQVLERTGGLPDAVAACVGGGSNAIGIFTPSSTTRTCSLFGFEAGGDGADTRARRDDHRRAPRRAARRPQLRAAGRGRADGRVALDLGRPRLPGRRAGARLPRRHRPRATYRAVTRRGGDGRAAAAQPHRGHHPGHRVRARPGRCARARQGARAGRDDPGQPLRPRRQGHATAVARWFDLSTAARCRS